MTIPGALRSPRIGWYSSPTLPRSPPDFVSEVQIELTCPSWIPALPLLAIEREQIGMFGFDHETMGEARAHPTLGRLTLSNIGATADDGVSIDLDDLDGGFRVFLEPVDLSTPETGIFVETVGSLAGASDTFLGRAGCRNNGGVVTASADFSSIGSPDVLVEVYNGGALAGSALVAAGDVAVVTGGPLIEAIGKLPPDPPCIVVDLDRLATVTPTGGAPILGDEVRLLASAASGTIDFLERFDLFGESLGSLTLVDEVAGDDTVGEKVCQANPSSCGAPAHISAEATTGGSGAVLIAANDLVLFAAPVPDEFGIFFHGPNPIRVPFGDGFLCVGGGLHRLLPPVRPDAACGTATRPVDISGFSSGSTAYFQYWFRDPAAGGAAYNTTNALCVRFQ